MWTPTINDLNDFRTRALAVQTRTRSVYSDPAHDHNDPKNHHLAAAAACMGLVNVVCQAFTTNDPAIVAGTLSASVAIMRDAQKNPELETTVASIYRDCANHLEGVL